MLQDGDVDDAIEQFCFVSGTYTSGNTGASSIDWLQWDIFRFVVIIINISLLETLNLMMDIASCQQNQETIILKGIQEIQNSLLKVRELRSES